MRVLSGFVTLFPMLVNRALARGPTLEAFCGHEFARSALPIR